MYHRIMWLRLGSSIVILISSPVLVNELSPLNLEGNNIYAVHSRALEMSITKETFVTSREVSIAKKTFIFSPALAKAKLGYSHHCHKSVCLSVCMCVCPAVHEVLFLRNYLTKSFQN